MGKCGPELRYNRAVMPVGEQLLALFILAIPVACVAWTVTQEEIFREPRDWCAKCAKTKPRLVQRKFFYLFTCEYCFSHYVSAAFLVITRYKLLFDDWRGYVVAGFALVWVANVYMSLFRRLRLDIKHEIVDIALDETIIQPTVAATQRGEPATTAGSAARQPS